MLNVSWLIIAQDVLFNKISTRIQLTVVAVMLTMKFSEQIAFTTRKK